MICVCLIVEKLREKKWKITERERIDDPLDSRKMWGKKKKKELKDWGEVLFDLLT